MKPSKGDRVEEILKDLIYAQTGDIGRTYPIEQLSLKEARKELDEEYGVSEDDLFCIIVSVVKSPLVLDPKNVRNLAQAIHKRLEEG